MSKRFWICAALVLVLAGWYWFPGFARNPVVVDADPARNRMVASLDDPVGDGDENIIWSAGLLVALDELGRLAPKDCPSAVLELLDEAQDARAALREEEYFSFAACMGSSSWAEAEARLERKFPGRTLPSFHPSPVGDTLVGYSFLSATLDFEPPYLPASAVEFETATGERRTVRAFGFQEGRFENSPRGHFQVLYPGEGDEPRARRAVVDLNAGAETEVILADAPVGDTLREAWEEVLGRLTAELDEERTMFLEGRPRSLSVPEIGFRLTERFPELQVNRFPTEIQQSIRFGLDRFGVEIESTSWFIVRKGSSGYRDYIFDGPFLFALRVRGRDHPYFLLWVRNPSLFVNP